jgi:hypothetical protein
VTEVQVRPNPKRAADVAVQVQAEGEKVGSGAALCLQLTAVIQPARAGYSQPGQGCLDLMRNRY